MKINKIDNTENRRFSSAELSKAENLYKASKFNNDEILRLCGIGIDEDKYYMIILSGLCEPIPSLKTLIRKFLEDIKEGTKMYFRKNIDDGLPNVQEDGEHFCIRIQYKNFEDLESDCGYLAFKIMATLEQNLFETFHQ